MDIKRKLKENFLITFFIIFICIPIFGLVFNIQDGLENTEKRNMAELPKLDFPPQSVKFLDDFLKYFEDNFGFRYTFMRFASNLKIKLFKTYPRNIDIKVLKGKDGWFFYKLGNEIEDFEGRVPFSDEKITKIIKNNTERMEKLAPAKFYILIPPDKTVIYPEFLPDSIRKKEDIQNSRIVGLLKSNSEIIYPKDVLIQNKDKGFLYFKTDTHWTYLGAYFGYIELINTIQKDFRDRYYLAPLRIEEFSKEEYKKTNPDLLDMVNIGEKNSEKSIHYICPQNKDINSAKSNLRVLIFGDSFLEYLKPHINCTFNSTRFEESNTLDMKIIKDFKPDIVVLEIVQRNLRQLEIPDKN